MNISASKFSSGCESGWTVYLDQTYISEAEFHRDQHNDNVTATSANEQGEDDDEEEEEEDLSMVSDASSGPPHYHYDYNNDPDEISRNESSSILAANYDNRSSAIKNMDRAETKKQKQKNKKMMMMIVRDKDNKCNNNSDLYHSCLDDTASSPISKNKSTFSRKEALMEYSHGFSATHFKGESAFGLPSQEPGEFQGGKWK